MHLRCIPVKFFMVSGREHDNQPLGKLPFDVVQESTIYMDAGYKGHLSEEGIFEAAGIMLKCSVIATVKERNEPYVRFLKEYIHKAIETDFSQIKAKMLRCIDAVTKEGFLLKVALFGTAYAFDKIA